MEICESNLRGQCSTACLLLHCALPYQWQISLIGAGEQEWWDLGRDQNIQLESHFSIPSNDGFDLKVEDTTHLEVSFDSMNAVLVNRTTGSQAQPVLVRRLSTCSYASDQEVVTSGGGKTERYLTQWVWHWRSGGIWMEFEKPCKLPQQFTLEAKYLYGQPIYRFTVDPHGDFLVDLRPGKLSMRAMTDGNQWAVKRRPRFLLPIAKKPLESPVIGPLPFGAAPENWSPVDRGQDVELVPLDPAKMEYHLVASAFHETLPEAERQIRDIFRVQNPFLWQKYSSKRHHMELQRSRQHASKETPEAIERQLFHGSRDENVVQAIFKQNFDWRVSGSANDVLYGRGIYFARDARLSDRYADRGHSRLTRWMFLARVLVGRTATGKRDFVRPPPLDKAKPHGELYDSCVNSVEKPSIFVVFDSDQCYPEYVLSYVKQQDHYTVSLV